MTLQNAGITHLLDRIVNLIGAQVNSVNNVSENPVELNSENNVSEKPVHTVVKDMLNMWQKIDLLEITINVRDSLKVGISDNGDYNAKFGGVDITSGALLNCKDGYQKNKVEGGRESAAVFLARNYKKYEIQILNKTVIITGKNSDNYEDTMIWMCSKKKKE